MTELLCETPSVAESLDERIAAIAADLELAARWHRPCILLAVYGSEYVRADAEMLLENELIDQSQAMVRVRLRDGQGSLFRLLQEHSSHAGSVFSIEAAPSGPVEGESLYDSLNNFRDFFTEFRIRAVIWLSGHAVGELARRAPDFWARRGRVIEFTEPPSPARLMQQALDFAWQGTGDYAGPEEDTDAKILLRESLLTGIPAEEEALSTRAHLLLTLGLLNWRKGDFEKADQQLSEALTFAEKIQDPWFEAECFNAVALLKSSMECTDEAIQAYKQAIRLAPGQISAWNNLGNLCAKIGRNDEALVTFLKAIEYNAEDPIAWNGLGNLYRRLGYTEDAIAAYRKSIQFLPSFAHPWNGLGDAYAALDRPEEAVQAYQRAIELNPDFVLPWLRLGELFTGQERHRDAQRAYQRALAIDPRSPDIWNELGLACSRSNAFRDAEEAFLKAIEIDRGFGWAYSNLGSMYFRQGRYAESLPLYQKSIELLSQDSQRVITWNRLGSAYRQLGDYEHAMTAYQAADQLEKGYPAPAPQVPADEAAPSVLNEAMQPAVALAPPEPAEPPETVSASDDPADSQVDATTPAGSTPRGEPGLSDAPAWLFEQNTAGDPAGEPEAHADLVLPADPAAAQSIGVNMLQADPLNSVLPGKQGSHAGSAESEVLSGELVENTDAFAWNEKGNIDFRQGAYENAIAAYHRAIALDPAFGWPCANLALTYFTLGQPDRAIPLYQKSIELLSSDPERAVSWSGLGDAYRSTGDYASALAAYRKAGELDPQTNGVREAMQSLHLTPGLQSARVLNDLGEIFLKAGVYDEAAAAFKKAISLEPAFGWPYSNLARTLAAQGLYSQAVPLYQKSIDLFADNKDKAVSWNRLGNAYRRLNDYDHAIKAFQEAVALNDDGMDLITRARFSLLSNCYAG
ncbi:MAG: tetratricopeptide repeat protein [Bacteroidota bacterium]